MESAANTRANVFNSLDNVTGSIPSFLAIANWLNPRIFRCAMSFSASVVDLMGDSAKMNIWLHKTVLARIAANGGNVPKELLD
jgi:hypothetical protein